MSLTHRMSRDSFRQLARGGSDAAGREVLRSAQLSKHMLLLRKLVDHAGDERRWLEPGLGLLGGAGVDSFQRVLGYPHVGAWLVSCLRRSVHWLDLAHLGSVAASAAIYARLDFEVPVPVRSGQVTLPGLGAVKVDAVDSLVVLHSAAGRCWLDAGAARVELPADLAEDGLCWQALRMLTGTSVVLDDVDPYRPSARLPFTGRLSDAEAGKWNRLFGEAQDILRDTDENAWDEVGDLLRAVVPLQSGPDGNGVSTTSRDAFGCFTATLPHSAEALAALSVHEVQHNKLAALHTLIPLVREERTERYYSPWRSDPRPAYGLLHGCYAFTAVADFWSRRSMTSPLAAFQFLRAAAQVRIGLRTLTDSADLTEDGRKFVAGLRRKTETWDTASFPADVRSVVDDLLLEHRVTWCLANMVVRQEDAATLAEAWLAGHAPGELPAPRLTDTAAHNFEAGQRLRLATSLLSTPDTFEAVKESYPEADVALVRQDYSAVRRLLMPQIARDTVAVWSGLALANSRIDKSVIWRERPELVRALRRRLGEVLTEPPAPDDIARWLVSGR